MLFFSISLTTLLTSVLNRFRGKYWRIVWPNEDVQEDKNVTDKLRLSTFQESRRFGPPTNTYYWYLSFIESYLNLKHRMTLQFRYWQRTKQHWKYFCDTTIVTNVSNTFTLKDDFSISTSTISVYEIWIEFYQIFESL